MELLVHLSEHGFSFLGNIYFVGGRDPNGDGAFAKLITYVTGLIGIFIWVVVLGVSGWIVSKRMQKKAEKDTGKSPDAGDLTSIAMWMKVDEAEQKLHPGQKWAPESSVSDYQPSKHDL